MSRGWDTFTTNAINTEDRKHYFLFSYWVYNLRRNLVAPDKLVDKPFAILVEVLEKYYSPKLSEIIQRF